MRQSEERLRSEMRQGFQEVRQEMSDGFLGVGEAIDAIHQRMEEQNASIDRRLTKKQVA